MLTTLKEKVREFSAGKRDLDRERDLVARLDASSARLERFLTADESTPSQQASHQEERRWSSGSSSRTPGRPRWPEQLGQSARRLDGARRIVADGGANRRLPHRNQSGARVLLGHGGQLLHEIPWRPAGASDTLGVRDDVDFLAASVASYPNSLGDALAELEAIILASPEFLSKTGATTSGFVEGLYESVLGRSATAGPSSRPFSIKVP